MPEWWIELVGSRQTLSRLSEEITRTQWRIVERDDRYFLRSEAIDQLEDYQTVRAQADAIVASLVNAAVLSGYSSEEIGTGSMTREHEDGRADHVIMVPTAQLTLTGHAPAVRTGGDDGPSLCEELTELLLSVNDGDVAQALRLLKTHPEDWTQLCNIVEIVKDNIGAAIPTDWASRNMLRRLSRTAQHSETAGDTARHVRHPSEPSETPMPISEAQTVIRSLLIHWVRNIAADTS